ncbi:TPA: cell division protein ZapA [Streptococcus suis]
MANLNRYKFTFGDKQLTLTTEHDNTFMEEIERLAQEKYQAIKEKMPTADSETLALLLAINTLSVQLTREKAYEQMELELESMKEKEKTSKQNVTLIDLDELEETR